MELSNSSVIRLIIHQVLALRSDFMKHDRLRVLRLLLSCHEWLLVISTLSYHDRMMMEEKEKETMLEEIYGAKGIR